MVAALKKEVIAALMQTKGVQSISHKTVGKLSSSGK